MEKVSIAKCDEYTPKKAERALDDVLRPIGGLDWVRPGMKIAIKANLVSFMKPEAAATTHPTLLCALTRMLRQCGASVVIGDSPGGLYTAAYVNRVYAATGMHETESAGAVLNANFAQSAAVFPEAAVARQFQYTAYLDDVDAIINFCKLKTHGMMGMSCAVKNMFGVIPGTMKPEYHFRFPNPEDFARMLVDLNEYFKPQLCIADAVIGMEGNGPTAGSPRKIGAVLACRSPYPLDLVCAALIGLKREDVPTLQASFERGRIPATVDEVPVCGDWKSFCVADYVKISNPNSLLFCGHSGPFGRLRGRVLQKLLDSYPDVQPDECVGCGECARICPAKAIRMDKLPVIDRKTCIHCFCCQEFCPKGAMKVNRTAIARLLNRSKKADRTAPHR